MTRGHFSGLLLLAALLTGCSGEAAAPRAALPAPAPAARDASPVTLSRGIYADSFYGECVVTPAARVYCQTTSDAPFSWGRGAAPGEGAFLDLSLHATAVALGHNGGCVTDAAGALECWGCAVDNGTRCSELGPRRVVLPEPVRRLSASGGRFCVLTRSGQMYCWGTDCTMDEPGHWNIESPEPATDGRRFDDVRDILGGCADCVLEADGDLWCRGALANEILGSWTRHPTPVAAFCRGTAGFLTGPVGASRLDALVQPRGDERVWESFPVDAPIRAFASSNSFGCALAGSVVRCWEMRHHGPEGQGAIPMEAVLNVPDATDLLADRGVVCALRGAQLGPCFGQETDSLLLRFWNGPDPAAPRRRETDKEN